MRLKPHDYSRKLLLCVLIELISTQSVIGFVDIFMSEAESMRLMGLTHEVSFVKNGTVEPYAMRIVWPLLWNITELYFSWRRLTDLPVHYSIDFPNATQYAGFMSRPTLNVSSSGVIPQRLSVFSVGLSCTPAGLREPRSIEFGMLINLTYQRNVTEVLLHRAKLCAPGNHSDLLRLSKQNQSERSVELVPGVEPQTPVVDSRKPQSSSSSISSSSTGNGKEKVAGSSAGRAGQKTEVEAEPETRSPNVADDNEPHAQTAERIRTDESHWPGSSGSGSSSSAFTYYIGIACSSGVIVALALFFAICYVYQKRRLVAATDANTGTNLALVSETTLVPLGAGGPAAMHTRNTLLVNLAGGSARLNANANLDVRLNAAPPWSSASSGGSGGKSKRGKHHGAYFSVPYHKEAGVMCAPRGPVPYASDNERYPVPNTPTFAHGFSKTVPNTPRLGTVGEHFSPDGFSLSSASASQASASHPNSRASHCRPPGDTSASASCANSCAYSPAPPPTPNANDVHTDNVHSMVHARSGTMSRRAASSGSRHSHSRHVQHVFAARRRMLAAQLAAENGVPGQSHSDATYQLSLSLPPPPTHYTALSDTQSQLSAATGSNASYTHHAASAVAASARSGRALRLAHACAGPPPSCGSSTISDGMSVNFGFGLGFTMPPLDAAGPCATSPLAMSVVTSLSGTPNYNATSASNFDGNHSGVRSAFSVPNYSELCSLFASVRADREAIRLERSTCVLEGTFGKLFVARIRIAEREDDPLRARLERTLRPQSKDGKEDHAQLPVNRGGSFCVLLKTVNEVGVHVHDEQIRVLLSDASLLVGCAHTNVAPLVAAVLNDNEVETDPDTGTDDAGAANGTDDAPAANQNGRVQSSRVPMLIYPLPALGILKLFLLEQASQFTQQTAGKSRSNWFALLNDDLPEISDGNGNQLTTTVQRDRDGSRRLVLSKSRHGGAVAYRGGLTTQQQLVMMSIHVLRGLMYLHRHHLFHGDVATRNCFVDGNLTVKLCDNALSRDLFPDEYNCLCDNLNRPIKWLAPETIQNHRQYTVASEMWSFGVLLWELLTKAQLPYLDLDPFEVFSCLYEGYRLPQPYSCPDDLYNFMLSCWTWQPADRPTPHQMLTNLNKFYAKLGLFL